MKSWDWRPLTGVTGSAADSLPDSPPSSRTIDSVRSVLYSRGDDRDWNWFGRKVEDEVLLSVAGASKKTSAGRDDLILMLEKLQLQGSG